ncbi:MAG: T9SS type A sorting domain-containing protein [Chitinophagaceae bacterium]
MKSVTSAVLRPAAVLLLHIILVAVFTPVKAQHPVLTGHLLPIIDSDINGFYDYLPRNYARDIDQKYPLIVFFHGLVDSGSDPLSLLNVLNAGVPKLLKNGSFPDSFNVKGKWTKFIVLAPQIKLGLFSPQQTSLVKFSTVDALIDYAVKTYRVDASRIYLSGLSMGGGVASDYVASSPAAAKRIAGVAIAAAASNVSNAGADNIVMADLPIIATHNTVDKTIPVGRTISLFAKLKNSLNKADKNKTQQAQKGRSIYWSTAGEGSFLGDDDHNAWSRTFENITPGSSKGGNLADTMGANVYEWLLQFSRVAESPLPLVWEKFELIEQSGGVNIQWTTSREIRTKYFGIEKSADGLQWQQIATIQAGADGETTHRYSLLDNKFTGSVTFYRIQQVDMDDKFTYSVIKTMGSTTVGNGKAYPNPFLDRITVSIPAAQGSRKLTIKLFDLKGVIVKQAELYAESGRTYNYSLSNLSQLVKGSYVLTVETEKKQILVSEKLLRK